MNRVFAIALLWLQTLALTAGLSLPEALRPHRQPRITTVHEFPKSTWIENIAQRASGPILVTEFTQPKLWQLDPSLPASQKPVLIANIANKLALFGIVEYAPDVFAIIGGNFSFEQGGIPGSFSIYSVDLNATPPKTSLLANMADAAFLNGLTLLPPTPQSPKGRLLAGDAAQGTVWALDLVSLQQTVVVKDPLALPCKAEVPGITNVKLGINGVRYDAGTETIYFTNSFCKNGLVAKVTVAPGTGRAAGPASVLSQNLGGTPVDDFAIDNQRHEALVALGTKNIIAGVDLKTGKSRTVAGDLNSTAIANPTAVYIGRTANDRRKGRIYVTTTGGLEVPINGTTLIGGQVVAVDLKA